MAKKMKFKVDWKKLFVEKGERIGLGVAAVLCVLMLVPMFWFMLFGQSAKAVVDELSKPADQLSKKQQDSRPDANDNPPVTKEGGTKVSLDRPKVDDRSFQMAQIFTPSLQLDTSKRQMPTVKPPVEARVEVAQVQLKGYFIDGEKIIKLVGEGGSTTPGAPNSDYQKMLSSAYQQQPMGKRPGTPGGRGNQSPSTFQQVGADNGKKDLKMEAISVTEIANLQSERLADRVMPVRMAVIAASFPYRAQIQEFQDKLHLKTMRDVATETTPAIEGNTEQARNTFFFINPLVERRQVDAHGNPLQINSVEVPWEPLDLGAAYLGYLHDNGMRFEQDSLALDQVSFENMVMPKLAVMGKNQYPPVEMSLTTLQTTLAALAKAKDPIVVKPTNPFKPDNFNPFGKPTANKMTKPGVGTGPMKEYDPNNADAYPEYCLIRVIDVTVKPGKFYQYRIKIRMANPNQGFPNVASPTYATRTEPLESDWFEVRAKKDAPAQVVAVPPEYHVYAVDQKAIDIADSKDHKYEGQHATANPDKGQAVIQIHKWLEAAEIDSRNSFPVGEWSVAERVFVYRGEMIPRRQRVELVYWRPAQESFVLAHDKDKSKKASGLEVDFGPPEGDDPILVDFEGGEVPISRVTGKKDGKDEVYKSVDKAGYETLILSPDGKLISHNSWTDKVDKERTERLKKWHDRIKEVKDAAKDTKPGPGTGTGTEK